MTNVKMDRNANNNISVWTSEILYGNDAGLYNVFCKIGGLIHVRVDCKLSRYDAEGMRYAIQTSEGIANTNRWRCTQYKPKPVLVSSESIVKVDLKENGNPNCGSTKGDVFACVDGKIYIHEGGKADSVVLAKEVRKVGKINLNHWKLTASK